MYRRLSISAVVALTAIATLGACGSSDSPKKISLEAKEFAFVGAPTGTVKGGLTTFTLDDTGKQFHFMNLVKVDTGKTDADVKKVMTSSQDPPSWVHDEGGIEAVTPGEKVSLTRTLGPGRYVMACFLPDAKTGKPHAALGMYTKIFSVSGTTSGKKAPKPDSTVSLSGSGFTVPKISAGERTLKLTNGDSKDHEFFFLRIPKGKSLQDVQKLFESQEPPKPPYDGFGFLGGPMKLAKGTSTTYQADFTAGDYLVVDPEAQPPLFKEFKVT